MGDDPAQEGGSGMKGDDRQPRDSRCLKWDKPVAKACFIVEPGVQDPAGLLKFWVPDVVGRSLAKSLNHKKSTNVMQVH